MPYYRRHLFFCENQREEGEPCCARFGASELRQYAMERCKALGIFGPGGVRVQRAGCLGRCDEAPVAVVYPDGVWYTYVDRSDIDEIVERHLVGGEVVERLRLPDEPPAR
ncbi:(2Fe-2S) ferredoxin domain-containing protein [Inmirania thermothiophila]|uniref:(2Fe-2S) ferredoxin n=1 Tax=Inmirania thermothiophila TaxID=1750597 RepID=A0A3N1XSD5_9GAMM|nr:(2Fe-2S) ferredoxin domain-containing protein [Inmirania thermothiophila]ROR29570.1 (2Fe-2S) ferredoxin [Inmirania thermothiophila]